MPSEISGDIHNIETSPRDVGTDRPLVEIAQTPVQMIKRWCARKRGQVVTPHLAVAKRFDTGVRRELAWGDPERVPARRYPNHPHAREGGRYKARKWNAQNPSERCRKGECGPIAAAGGKYSRVYFLSFFGYFPTEPVYHSPLPGSRRVQYASETLTHPFMDLTHF